MAAKVADQSPLAETRRSQPSAGAATAAAPANSPKISMLGAKSGVSFVIPKNKLSGALVPVARSGRKLEPHDAKKEEDAKLPQRKTKWGIDLTQDPAVKRGRALAYQTRAEQIAALLESGNLEIDCDADTRSPSPPPVYDSSGQRINTREARKREQLDLERREAIGECIRLNPSYKPPAGYKPVYKEAKICIPVKDYPGFNFVGLILGPEGSTKKRLEEETGTKIIIPGMGEAEGKQALGIHSDGMEVSNSSVNEDLPVHISADTYEKVDAAMAMLELLVTTVDGNIPPGASTRALGDSSKALEKGSGVSDTRYSMSSSELSQGTSQPMLIAASGPQQMPLGWSLPASGTEALRGQFQPPRGNWNLMGANNSAVQVPHCFSVPPSNSPSRGMNNGNMFFPRFPQPGFNSFYPFPFVRGRPPLPGFNPHAMPMNLRSTMFGSGVRVRPPFHVQQRPYMPETAPQNQSVIVMNPTAGVFGSPRPQPVPGGLSQPAYPAYPTGSNALMLPPSNPSVAGGAGPRVLRDGGSTSASLPAGPLPAASLPAASAHVPVPVQHHEGTYQQGLQFSGQPSNQISRSGTAIELLAGAPPGAHAAHSHPVFAPAVPSPALSAAAPSGAHAAVAPPVVTSAVPSPGLSAAVPSGVNVALPSPVVSPVVPSPGLSAAVPSGVNVAVPPPVVSPVMPSPGLSAAVPSGVNVAVPPAVVSPIMPSPGLSAAVPSGVNAAVPPPVVSPVVPSPRLSAAVPSGVNVAVPPPVVSPVVPSPGLPATPSPGARPAVLPSVVPPVVPSPGLRAAPPPGARVAVLPPVASPVGHPPANTPLAPPSRAAFIPQVVSGELSSAALPGLPASSNPVSSILPLGGGMHNAGTISLGAPVATMQSGVTNNRPIGQPPTSAGTALTNSQGSSVPASAASNTWQPQHLTSGDFTFQPLRSQALPSSSGWSQPSLPPSLADVQLHSQNPVPQNSTPVMKPGFQPVIPGFPRSLPPQIRVNPPSLPASANPPAPPPPPMPPLPPQAPSFRPAISPPSSSLGISPQASFSIPSQLSGSQSVPPPMPPPRLPFLGSAAQPVHPRAPAVVLNPPFGSSAPQPICPPLPPRPHPGPESHPPFPSVSGIPSFQRQEVPASQPFQHSSHSNVPGPPRGPPPTCTSHGLLGNSSAALSGDASKQLPGPVFLQQQSSPMVLHNISTVPNNVQHNLMSASPQMHLPASPQPRPVVSGQNQASMICVSGTHVYDFGNGGNDKTADMLVTTGEGAGNQNYDPFSPTSIPSEQTHVQNDQETTVTSKTDQNIAGLHDRQDTDADYENLMASVGVR